MTKRLGIIGYPIGHSISPIFQQVALDSMGIGATYEKWEVTPDSLGDFVNGLRASDTLGINITLPHKQAVIPFLDEVDEWAGSAGAVTELSEDAAEADCCSEAFCVPPTLGFCCASAGCSGSSSGSGSPEG